MKRRSKGGRHSSVSDIILFCFLTAVFFSPFIIHYVRKAAFHGRERQVLKDLAAEFPAAEVIETTYEGSAFSPDPVTVYAIDNELGFPFISRYHRSDGYTRSNTELGCYELRLAARQAADRVAAQIPQYLTGSYTVRYAADGAAGFAVFTEETDRGTLTALWNGLRETAESGEMPVQFSVIIAEPDLLARMLSRTPSEIIRAQEVAFRSISGDSINLEVPTFWDGPCSSLFYDYVTDPEQGFDHMDEACSANTIDRFVRQLRSDPDRTEYIMTVFNVW